MAYGKKVCKVCGKEYEACHTQRPYANGEFRWQDVACCPEHGAEYLRQIRISRGLEAPEPKREVQPEVKPAEPEVKPEAPKQTKRRRKAPAKSAE